VSHTRLWIARVAFVLIISVRPGSAEAQSVAAIEVVPLAEEGPTRRAHARIEAALDEWIFGPSAYYVEASRTDLHAGSGAGLGVELRWIDSDSWSIDAQLMTVRRLSDDAMVSRSRLYAISVGLTRRFILSDRFEARIGARGGPTWVLFDDADAVTTGLGLTALAMFQVKLLGPVWLELLGGGFGQPWGGNGVTDIRIAPTPFFAVGIAGRAPSD